MTEAWRIGCVPLLEDVAAAAIQMVENQGQPWADVRVCGDDFAELQDRLEALQRMVKP